jgi:RNA ligase
MKTVYLTDNDFENNYDDRFNWLIKNGYINLKEHPNGKLKIYNYSKKTQYEGLWEHQTMVCRGLITDLNDNIVARGFEKFFNYDSQIHSYMHEYDYDVYEKLDGSLGILYFYEDVPSIATRGSFDSPQALFATEILHTKYKHVIPKLDKRLSYLFEIIQPENKIVVDYQDTRDIVLIGIIETISGEDIHLDHPDYAFLKQDFNVVKNVDKKSIKALCKDDIKNKEGYVIRLKNGTRIKIKFENYVLLHSLVDTLTNVKVWKMLSDNSYSSIIEDLTDDMRIWVRNIANKLIYEFKKTKIELEKRFASILSSCDSTDRKEIALKISKDVNKSVLFAMLNNKKQDVDKFVWNIVKPVNEIKYEKI